jgi:hypothetical protein
MTNTGLDSEISVGFSTPLSIVSNQPAFISDTLSLRRIVNAQNVQRWEIEANMVPSSGSPSFLTHSVMNGYATTIYIRMPQIYRPANDGTFEGLTITTNGPFSRGAKTINLLGMSGHEIATGEFITFSGDTKVYLVTDGGSGGVGVGIFPGLISAKSSGTSVKYGSKVTLSARYDSSTALGIRYSDGVLSDPGSTKFVEAL